MTLLKRIGRKFTQMSLPPRLVFNSTSVKRMATKDMRNTGRNLELLNDFNREILEDTTFPVNHNPANDELLATHNVTDNRYRYPRQLNN